MPFSLKGHQDIQKKRRSLKRFHRILKLAIAQTEPAMKTQDAEDDRNSTIRKKDDHVSQLYTIVVRLDKVGTDDDADLYSYSVVVFGQAFQFVLGHCGCCVNVAILIAHEV